MSGKTLKLTRGEERDFIRWFIDAVTMRPEDFDCGQHWLRDLKTGIKLWIGSGRGFIHIQEPVEFSYLRRLNQWRAWRVIEPLAARARERAVEILRKAMRGEMVQRTHHGSNA